MVNDVESMQIHLDDALLLLTDLGLGSADEVESLRGLAIEAEKPLLLIAEDYSAEAVATLLDDSEGPDIVAVHPPEYGKWRQAMMEDIAVMTGGPTFSNASATRMPVPHWAAV